MKLLNTKEKKQVSNFLKERFGIKEINGLLIKFGEERIYLYNGNLEVNDLLKIQEISPIERIGFYFAKQIGEEFKLSLEGVEYLKNQIVMNIIEISNEEAELWMQGQDIPISTENKGFIIIKNKETGDLLGSGKASEHKIGNFIPKSRRIRIKGN